MSMSNYGKKIEALREFSYDAVDHLTADLAAYDPIYAKLAQKRKGQMACLLAVGDAFRNDYIFDKFDVYPLGEPTLLPAIQIEELQTVMTSFAQSVGSSYISRLFHGTLRKNRPYEYEVFPYEAKSKSSASVYIHSTWAPVYGEEFALAHSLGLTKELAEITGGAEAIS